MPCVCSRSTFPQRPFPYRHEPHHARRDRPHPTAALRKRRLAMDPEMASRYQHRHRHRHRNRTWQRGTLPTSRMTLPCTRHSPVW